MWANGGEKSGQGGAELIDFAHNLTCLLCRTPFARFPKISGKEVDLYKLYVEVTSRGGWLKVQQQFMRDFGWILTDPCAF